MNHPSPLATEARLAALWSPRRLIDDYALRLVILVALAVLVLACRLPGLVPLLTIGLIVAAARAGGRAIVGVAALSALIALGLNALTEPGEAIARLGPLAVTREGIDVGVARAVRIAGLVALGRLALEWVEPWSLAEVIDRGGGTPEHPSLWTRLALTIGLALRLVPALGEEAERLMLAARVRPGAARGVGAARMRELAPLFLPLLAGTIRGAGEMALTLDARCFATGPRSSRLEPPRRGPRRVACGLVVAIVAALLVPGRV